MLKYSLSVVCVPKFDHSIMVIELKQTNHMQLSTNFTTQNSRFPRISPRIDNPRNWALIDTQNLYKEVIKQGWKIDWFKLKKLLCEKYSVSRVILFMGFVEKNMTLYKHLYNAGFQIWFRKVKVLPDGSVYGGNVDSDIVVFALEHKEIYSKLIIVSDDKDYREFYMCLLRLNKLERIISSHTVKRTSKLIKEILPNEMITGIDELRRDIEYKTL
jgi:hypothetical protein